MKIESSDPVADKARWKIVRTDDYTEVAGDIVAADDASGECSLIIAGETKQFSFGAGGFRIVSRRR